MWHEGLEEASRLYFTEKNPEGMIAALDPLHDMIEAVGLIPFFTSIVANSKLRAQRLLGRPHLHKYLEEISMRLVRRVVVTAYTAKLVNLIRPGIFTME